MDNWDRKTAWHYHNGTKHPNGYLMAPGHLFDPMSQPLLFKIYTDLEPIPLPGDASLPEEPALSAISTNVAPDAGERTPDIASLGAILYYSAGITKKLRYPWGELPFRAAACTGALYHIELYVVCGDLPGLESGIYHFDPGELALRRRGRATTGVP